MLRDLFSFYSLSLVLFGVVTPSFQRNSCFLWIRRPRDDCSLARLLTRSPGLASTYTVCILLPRSGLG